MYRHELVRLRRRNRQVRIILLASLLLTYLVVFAAGRITGYDTGWSQAMDKVGMMIEKATKERKNEMRDVSTEKSPEGQVISKGI